MATVLQRRGDPGDLLRAIEEWERVLELDSGSPRSEILDALMLALDSTQNTPRSVWLSQKIAKFDTTDQVKERAKRTLLRRAAAKMEGGSRSAVKNAIKLFEAAGDSENAAVASSLAARQEKIENLGVATFFTAIGLAIVLGLLPVSARLADLQILLCAVAGVTILWGDRSQRDGNLSIRHAGLLGIPIGMVIGEVVLFLINDMIVVGWLTVLAAGIAGNWNAPKFVMDIEGDPLKPTEPAKGILLRLLDSFIKKLLQLRDRLAQRAMRKAELKG